MNPEIKPARTRVTPSFAKWEGPQRYVNHDPRPDLPLEEDGLTYDRADKAVAWVLGFAVLVILGLDLLEMFK